MLKMVDIYLHFGEWSFDGPFLQWSYVISVAYLFLLTHQFNFFVSQGYYHLWRSK